MFIDDYYEERDRIKNKYQCLLIAGIFFGVVLLAFFAAGTYMLVLQIKALSYVAVEAAVVDFRTVYENDPHDGTAAPYYYYVVEYEIDGQKYRKSCDTPASKYSPPDGAVDTITVYVNSGNPEDVVFKNSTHIVMISVTYVVCIGGFVAIGFVFGKAYKIKQQLKKFG